jgi:hypothetical protein
MSIKEEITAEIIANTICLDTYDGYYILVEGETDELFYSKFLDNKNCQIEICHGKENTVKAINIINQRSIKKKEKSIAIVDKDFDFLDDKLNYPDNLLQTDCHDIEMMCLKSDSFDSVMNEYFSKEKVEEFNKAQKKCIRQHLLNTIRPISELRILSKKENLNLSFKPSIAKPNELKYDKFICKDKFEFKGYEALLNAIKTYYNQATHLDNKDIILKLQQLDLAKYEGYDICHGHDLTKAIHIGLKKKIGKSKLSDVTADEIERSMRLAFSIIDFKKTDLKQKLDKINDKLVKNNVA